MSNRATVRVFVPTYRRHDLLRRAIKSLLAQTHEAWICEIHNDDPLDDYPSALAQEIGDNRITVINHERNLGAVATFNLFYRPIAEPFMSMLEDDNWWLPRFLEKMVAALQRKPKVTVAWCNQQIWEELPDHSWRNTGALVNPDRHDRVIHFGDDRQVMGAIHSNGAMLLRTSQQSFQTPDQWPFVAVEPFRERMFPHPMVYIAEPLAVFSKTLQTARKDSRAEDAIAQTILAAAYVAHAPHIGTLLNRARFTSPPTTNSLLMAAIADGNCRKLLRYSILKDWLLLLRGMIRRPNVFIQVLLSKRRHPDWWQSVSLNTAYLFKTDATNVTLPTCQRARSN